MNQIIIRNLSEELMDETVNFISLLQNTDDGFVAWLGYSPEEIRSQLTSLAPAFKEGCFVALDEEEVCGFLGIYVSEEQSTLRLLGPYISRQKDWVDIAIKLLSALKEKIPSYVKTAKVAFYNANINCKEIYEANNFHLYNAEKTLILNNRNLVSLLDSNNQNINIRYYKSSDYNDLICIHPANAYFTGDEVISRLNSYNQLIVAELDNKVIGYIYFEMFQSDGFAEICFVNVSSELRGMGIGSLLINRAISEAFKYDWVKHIQISVRVNNESAERLYMRIGFKEKNLIVALQRDMGENPWEEFRECGVNKTY